MIIYGYREATLQAGTFEGAVCPHCGQQGHAAGAVFRVICILCGFRFFLFINGWTFGANSVANNLM